MDVYYAGKAFLCTAVARWIAEEGLGLDVCTGGELAVALAAGFPPERIGLHGNNKSRRRAAPAPSRAGVGHVVVDSFDEIDRLAAIAAAAGVRQRVLVRVTVGVEAHTHEYIATAHEDQKFGFSLRDGAAERAVAAVLAARRRWTSPGCTRTSARRSSTPPASRSPRTGWSSWRPRSATATASRSTEINLGGGLGIAYVAGDDPETPKQTLERLQHIVERECARGRAAACRGCRSSRAARSSGRRPSPSTRSAR